MTEDMVTGEKNTNVKCPHCNEVYRPNYFEHYLLKFFEFGMHPLGRLEVQCKHCRKLFIYRK